MKRLLYVLSLEVKVTVHPNVLYAIMPLLQLEQLDIIFHTSMQSDTLID